jgi:hypothetical protein
MSFIQIIEYRTKRIAEFDALLEEWLAKSAGWRTSSRGIRTRDRDDANTYLQIVEFPSYEKAMENSGRPETKEFADRLTELCEGPPTFRNLDVLSVEEM